MKKFYLIALGLATVASASAAVRQTGTVVPSILKAQEQTVALSKTVFKAPSTGYASIEEVAGEYTWNYYGILNGDSGPQEGVVEITVTNATTGEVAISGIVSSGTGITTPVKATVDLSTGTLTLPNRQDLGQDSYGDQNYFYIKGFTEDGEDIADGAIAAESVAATIEDGVFTFPEDCIFAVGDFNDESLGWWKLTAFNTFTQYTGSEDPGDLIDPIEWEDLSTDATLIDGWILPVITYQDGSYVDPNDFPLTVTVLKHVDNPKLLAVENPYLQSSGFPLSGGLDGYIVIDITDPDFVIVNTGVFSGFMNGTNRVYCFNVEGYYTAQGYSKEVIQESITDVEWSTCKVEGNTITIDITQCRFNYPGAEDKMYTWTGRVDAMKAKLTIVDDSLTGINTIAAEESQAAPVEYYNLQGIRVANPENGVYIRCAGDKATKVLVK